MTMFLSLLNLLSVQYTFFMNLDWAVYLFQSLVKTVQERLEEMVMENLQPPTRYSSVLLVMFKHIFRHIFMITMSH